MRCHSSAFGWRTAKRSISSSLVLNLATKEWKMPPWEWSLTKAPLAILFEDR